MGSRTTFAAVLALVASWVPRVAVAQAPSRQELVERGVARRDMGDHLGALDLFRRAGEIEMRPGLRMSIAQEEQALGRVREACESSMRCVEEARVHPQVPQGVREGCPALVEATCGTLGRVNISVAPSVPEGLAVSVEDRAVNVVRGSATVVVNPGEVLVAARVGGRTVFTRRVSITRGATASVTVDVPRAGPSVTPPVERTTAHAPATPHPREDAAATPSITSRWWFWTGLAAIVVGGTLAGLAAGGVFDYRGAPAGGTAYTVEAITAR